VRVHRPPGDAAPSAALLWIHGGCYVIGCAAQDDRLCQRFAQALGVVVASVEYRVAPENPYPAALDDCTTALHWLANQADVDSTRIAIGGASAGGGLTAALALRLRDEGTVRPVMQLLTYPMLDDRPAFKPDPDAKRRRLMGQGMNRLGWESYLRGVEPDDAVPARAVDLGGLPPAWIGVGTHDLLHNEDVEYADRLKQSGVSCALEIVPGAFHGFDLFAPKAVVSQRFFEAQCAALAGALKSNA
jgi:acetyl esterase/lipase